MNTQDFCFWLRGYFEINGEQAITKEQAEIISKHLTLVFEQKAKYLPSISKADVASRFPPDYMGDDVAEVTYVKPNCTVSC